MLLLIGSLIILLSFWIVANDPTVLTWRRRMRLEADLPMPSENVSVEEVVAVYLQAPLEMREGHSRRRAGGRMKSQFRSKPAYRKRKAR